MKPLVSGFHALQINGLARLPLIPYSRMEWICRTQDGTSAVTIPITVLQDALQLLFPLNSGRALQTVRLKHSLGYRGGKRLWFACPTCARRVGVLYHQNGLPFRCRICCDLAYPSQYQARNQSYERLYRGLNSRERDRLSGNPSA